MPGLKDAKLKALPEELTQLYFRLVLPMVAVAALWAVYMAEPHDYRLVAPFSLVLLLAAPLYSRIPVHWQWPVRLSLAVFHVLMVGMMALLARRLGWLNSPTINIYGTNILFLVTPITVLSWNFLFYDHPRLGRLLSFLLSLSATALVAQWLWQDVGEVSLAVMLLIACLLAGQFGWNVTMLQRQAILGERDARHDALTGLLNRRAFNEAQDLKLLPGLLAVLDIDHFKLVNDTFGHPAGDRVLRAIADVLMDMLPGTALAYRWGGEEFVLLLPAYTKQETLTLMEKVRQEVALRSFVGGTHVTLSVGISHFGPDANLLQAFAQADEALLRAKRTGRNRVLLADAEAA